MLFHTILSVLNRGESAKSKVVIMLRNTQPKKH